MNYKSTPTIMGILNVTPDSYYDGGQYQNLDKALLRCEQMVHEGAQIIDLGGESTRPGAKAVSLDTELQRVMPLIEAIKPRFDVLLSIDTRHTPVMQAALEAGVDLINDVQALTAPGALEVVAKYNPYVCLMHMQGQPQVMQQAPTYTDVVEEVKSYLQKRINAATDAGIDKQKLIVDPGFGFGKNLKHNLTLLHHLGQFTELGCPILIGISRKSMFEHLLGLKVEDRLSATLSATAIAVWQGANIIRTHDVKETKECVMTAQAIKELKDELYDK